MVRERYTHPHFNLVWLGSLINIIQYGTSKRSTNEPSGVPVLRIPNLQAHGWDLSDLKYLPLSADELARYRLEKGDILFNRTNGSRELVGKCEVFDFEGDWVFASYLIRIRIDTAQAIPEFITAFLNTYWGRRQVEHVSRQILMSNINAEEIKRLRIPLPDLPGQRRLLAKLEAARAARRQKLAKAVDLLSALDGLILELIGLQTTEFQPRMVGAVRVSELDGPLNAERYLENSPARRLDPNASLPLDVAFSLIDEKITPAETAPEKEWGCVRIDDVGNEPLDPPEPRRVNGEELIGSFFPIEDSDLLIARLGPPLLNGKIIVAQQCETRTVCSPEFLVLRPNGQYDPDVAMWILRSRAFRRVLYSKCRGSTPSRYRLVREDLGSVRLPLLTETQQKRLGAEIARRRNEARRLRNEANALWEDARRLFEAQLLGPESVAEEPQSPKADAGCEQ